MHEPGRRGGGRTVRRPRRAHGGPTRFGRRQRGAAQPLLLLASALESARPGEVIVVVALADGAEVTRCCGSPTALAAYRPRPTLAAQIAGGAPISYGKFLTWRGMLTVEPPRRPEPRASRRRAPPARNEDWKFGFVGSGPHLGAVHLPPSGSMKGGASTTWTDRGRRRRHHRHLHRRPAGLLPQPADGLRRASTSTAAAGSRWS